MKRLRNLFFMIILAALVVNWQPVHADGIIIPDPPVCPGIGCPPTFPPIRPMSQLEIRYHHVEVKIENQIAIIHVDQVFYNPNDWEIEGTYMFPLPTDSVISQFALWMDGKPVEGKVLDAKQARAKYEEIVRQMRDPALLEYSERGAFQASLYPIPPEGERRIELEYQQVLTAENGLVKFVYPLNTEKFSKAPLDSVVISASILSDQPVRAVYSPSHAVNVNDEKINDIKVTYEALNVTPDSDFVLYYSLGETQAFHLFSYRDPSDPLSADGYFMLLLAPPLTNVEPIINKDVLLVLDRSGSMDGEKFEQARSAMRYILEHLNPGDRFYLSGFSSNIQNYADQLRPSSEADKAVRWAAQLHAEGSTDINRALLEAANVADPERPTYLIFMTDGLATEGVTDSQKILDAFNRACPAHVALFAFGVGYDVDTFLLDSLTQDHHGISTYVQPGEALDETLSAFYARISTPVLTNLQLDFNGLNTYDLYPSPLPDLFSGSQIVAVGRYQNGGSIDARLSGQTNGKTRVFDYEGQELAVDNRDAPAYLSGLPRLWATRKIGYLMNKIRLDGVDKETIDQIVQLSVRYGIVTPYTSYLVTEPDGLSLENQQNRANEIYTELQEMPAAPTFGREAVEKAAQAGAMSRADIAAAAPAAGEGDTVTQIRTAGSHVFLKQGEVWVDTAFDSQSMKPLQILFLSKAYFKLAEMGEDVSAALALGERVLLVADGKAFEVVLEGGIADPSLVVPRPSPSPTSLKTVTPLAEANQPTVTSAMQEEVSRRMFRLTPIGAFMLCGLAALAALVWFRLR